MRAFLIVFISALFLSLTACTQNSNHDLSSLSGMTCHVVQDGGTERAFTGKYWDFYEEGIYKCVQCQQDLFASNTKYKSGSGWPSYYKPIDEKAVSTKLDTSYGWVREELICSNCNGHLGHVFKDGPAPTGLRYCINSASLEFSPTKPSEKLDSVLLGAGCFWCIEAFFQEIKAVKSVTVGYAGGDVANPTYKAVCSGTTGHAEVAKIVYDSEELSLSQILEIFFKTHDPTQLNRQGYDIGTQYRSAIFYKDEHQKETAEKIIQKLNKAKAFEKAIVTTLEEWTKFYVAEDYHQNYFINNTKVPYCKAVIQPKLEKYQKVFEEYNK